MNSIKYLSILFLILSQLYSQDRSGALRTARLMEKRGDVENAIAIYSDILNKKHDHQAYINLKKILLRQEKFDSLSSLIQTYKERFPNKIEPYLDLGEAYWKLKKNNLAKQEWSLAENKFGSQSNTYKKFFYLFNNLGLSEESQAIIDRARKKFKDPNLLSIDIANYHFSRKSFKVAVTEYLNYLSSNPVQIKMVTDRILLISDDEDSNPIILAILNEKVGLNPVLYGPLLADYYFKTQQYALSLAQHLSLGFSTKKDVRRWMEFSNSLRAESQYEKAIYGYEKILSIKNKHVTNTVIGQALLGLGNTFEDKIIPNKIAELTFISYFDDNLFFHDPYYHQQEISVQSLDTAFELYDSLLTSKPSSSFSSSAYFRLGEIQYKLLGDFDGAFKSYHAAKKSGGKSKLRKKIQLRIGDIHIAKGELNKAQNYFKKRGDTSDEFHYKYILSQLFSGNIDTASILVEKAINKSVPIASDFNDLLELRTFISKFYENGSDNDKNAFKLFVLGEFYLKQKKLTEAIASYTFIQNQYPKSSISNDAILREALIRLKLNQISEAFELAGKLTHTKLAPTGLALLGEINEKYYNNTIEALDFYLKLLEKYPDSYLAEPIRLHVRSLNDQIKS